MGQQSPKYGWKDLTPEPGKIWVPLDERKREVLEDPFLLDVWNEESNFQEEKNEEVHSMKDFLKKLRDALTTPPRSETLLDPKEITLQLRSTSEYVLKGRIPRRAFPVSEHQPADTTQKCEGVVYDVLAYYKQWKRNDWGIYYVLRNIEDDLSYFSYVVNKYVTRNEEVSAVVASFLIYPTLITFHELCHHTLTLVRMRKGETQTYDPFDESLCEYTAFTLVEYMKVGYPIYPPITLGDLIKVNFDQISGKISVIVPSIYGRIKLETYADHVDRYVMVSNPLSTLDDEYIIAGESLIYYLWNRHKMKPNTPKSYAPAVPGHYENIFLAEYWYTYREQLILFGDHLNSSSTSVSVWSRLGLDSRHVKDVSVLC